MKTAGSLKIFKNNFWHYYWSFIIRKLPYELLRQLPCIIRNYLKTEQEKFQIDMENNLNTNKFNI